MKQQITLPRWSEVRDWLNDNISSQQHYVADLKDLTDGTSYLYVLQGIFHL